MEHPEFQAISEMRILPQRQWLDFISYAMREHRCDLIRHWVARGARPKSDLWLNELSKSYAPALLDVLPVLLETRPLSLNAAKRLLKFPEVCPYLANYLHALPIEELVDGANLEQVQFLDKLFDLSAPIILSTFLDKSRMNGVVAKFLYDRCADVDYVSLGERELSIKEALAVRLVGECLPNEARSIIDFVSEQSKFLVRRLMFPHLTLREDRMRDRTDLFGLARELLGYGGSAIEQLMVESLVSYLGWATAQTPPADFDHRDPHYPLVWSLFHHPSPESEERIHGASRNQLLCACLAHPILSPRLNQLITANLQKS